MRHSRLGFGLSCFSVSAQALAVARRSSPSFCRTTTFVHEHQFINNLIPLCYHALYYCKFVRNKNVCLMSSPPHLPTFLFLSKWSFLILFRPFTLHPLTTFWSFWRWRSRTTRSSFLKTSMSSSMIKVIIMNTVQIKLLFTRKSPKVSPVTIHIISCCEPTSVDNISSVHGDVLAFEFFLLFLVSTFGFYEIIY